MSKFSGVARDDAGNALASATVTVYNAGTSTLASIFSDRALATALVNPFTAEADGTYTFHAAPGEYRIKVSKAGFDDHDEDFVPVGLVNEAWAIRGDHASSHLEIQEVGGNKVIRVEPGLPADALVVDADENFGFGSDGFANMVGPGIGLDAVGTAPTTNPTGKALIYIDGADGHKLKVRTPNGNVYVLDTLTGIAASPYAGVYHPDRAPTSGTVADLTEEWVGGAQRTWTWANQSTATEVEQMDVATLTSPTGGATRNIHCRWLDGTALSATDYTFVAKMALSLDKHINNTSVNNAAGGICLLLNGTIASPGTDGIFTVGGENFTTGTNMSATVRSRSSYNSDGTDLAGASYGETRDSQYYFYFMLQYRESDKAVFIYYSKDGIKWLEFDNPPSPPRTVANTPLRVGRFVQVPAGASRQTVVNFHWFRTFNSLTFQVGS